MQEPRYIQIGTTAARNPKTGEFLPAAPIFAEITPEIEAAGFLVLRDIAALLADRLRQYMADQRKA